MEMKSFKKTKFNIGDEVIVVSNNTKGIIKSITSYLGEGDNIYLVTINGKDKTYIEDNLYLIREKNLKLNIDMKDLSMNFKIEDKIKEIIKKLDLKTSSEPSIQLLNACKLQKYLIINDEYVDDDFRIGKSVAFNELYHGLLNGDFDFLINAYIFSEILTKVGMSVLAVAMKDEQGEYYVSNLVLIDNEYYYFDVTLEMAVYQDNGSNPQNFVLCCGGLGKKSYEQFFKPLCLIDFKNNEGDLSLPKNISKEDIDIDIINKILKMGLDKYE